MAAVLLLHCLTLTVFAQSMPDQLSELTICKNAGYTSQDLQDRREMLSLGSDDGVHERFIPMFSSADLTLGSSTAKRAVLWTHGLGGDAQNYFCQGMQSLKAAGHTSDDVVAVAPWFGNELVTGSMWVGRLSDYYSIHWNTSRWLNGGDSDLESWESVGVSSFRAFDVIANHLRNKTLFPHLQDISFTGFSAGAQCLSRWAFFSDANMPGDASGVPLSTIVADAGSYMYLDRRRPTQECRLARDTGVKHTCANFTSPTADEQTACTKYDHYKYGTDVSHVSDSAYVQAFTDNTRMATARQEFATKDVRFLFGDQDSCNCNLEKYGNGGHCYPADGACSPNQFGGTYLGHGCCDTYPDSNKDNDVNNNCESELGGTNRLQRGLNYVSYLRAYYPNSQFPMSGIFSGEHNASQFFHSSQYMQWVYG